MRNGKILGLLNDYSLRRLKISMALLTKYECNISDIKV